MQEPCIYRISIKGLATNAEGQILLAKDHQGRWDLPGGGLEHGEEPTDALYREIMEETGLRPTKIAPQPCFFTTAARSRSYNGYAAIIVYPITLDSIDFTPSDECQEMRYFSVKTARSLLLFPAIEKFLEQYDPAIHGLGSPGAKTS